MTGSLMVAAAAASLVGTHLILSSGLRRPLVRTLGEKGFSGVYSAVAFVTLGATIWAYRASPTTAPLWAVGGGLWAIATVAMLLASILLLGSVVRNPALPGASANAATASARGVYAVTRHPMMWAIAIWGLCHILVYPIAKNVIVSGAIIALALVGSALQDRRKLAFDPLGWAAWESRTSFVPLVAIVQGRATFGGFGGHALGGGVVVWLVATWAHIPLAGWRAGVWRWIL